MAWIDDDENWRRLCRWIVVWNILALGAIALWGMLK